MYSRMKLSNGNLLEVFGSEENAHLLKLFTNRRFKKKETIYPPNHEENLVFLVKEGRIRVYLAYGEKEFTLSILEAGDIYSTHTRAYTEALEDCELLVTSLEGFGRVMLQHPSFTLTLINVLGDLLKNSITIINGLVFQEAHQRLAEFLIRASEDKGKRTEEGIVLELGLSSEQIAGLVGTTRQTVSLLLNDFYKAGILKKINRRKVVIKDIEQLKKRISGH